jgi:Fe-S cluster biogenesis protein NfuA
MSSAVDLKERVAQILRDEIGPALGLDSAALEVLAVHNGVAQVRFSGACRGCPSRLMAVIHGIEQELRRRVPEIDYLEAVP